MADDLQSNIVIRVLDAFTGPLRNLKTGITDAALAADQVQKKFRLAADLNQASEAAGRFGAMVTGPLKASLDEFMGFEKAMSRVQALTGTTKGSEALELLKKQAQELGAATSYSSEEAAEAMQAYAQAGFKVNEILAVVPQTMSAAKANATSLGETAAIVGGTLNAMGIDVAETTRVVDVLTKAGAESNASLQDLGHALAIAGPAARQSGMSIELTSAMIGKLRDANIDASSAGTGLRAVMQRLINPSNDAKKSFTALGISAKELAELQAQVASGKLDQVLKRIGEAGDKLPDAKRLRAMGEIFGLEASSAANVLITASMDTSGKGLGALHQSLRTLNDDTNRMAAVMDDNLAGAVERATGALSGLKTSVGEALAPTAYEAAGKIERLAGSLTKWVGQNPKATKATLELVTGLGALSFGLKGALLAASTFTSASASVQASFAKLSSSMIGQGGLVLAAAAAGYAIGNWANETFDLTERINKALGRGKTSTQDPDSVGHARGWFLSKTSGEVTGMGQGRGPAIVQEARAHGAATQEEINAYIRSKRGTAQLASTYGAQAGGTMLERTALGSARAVSPLADPGSLNPQPLPKTLGEMIGRTIAPTEKLSDEMARLTSTMSEVQAEMRLARMRAGLPVGITPSYR